MANNKSKKSTSKKKNTQKVDGNPGLLFVLLLLCVAVLIFIVFRTQNDNTDTPNETDTPKTVGTEDIVTDTTSEPENVVNDTDTTDIETEKPTDSVTTTVETENVTEDVGYTVETEAETQKTDNGDAIMEYPTIDSPEESAVDAELINSIIRDYMNDKLREEQFEESITDPDVTYRYEIKSTETKLATKDFISVLIKGEYYIVDLPHPTLFAYTINCDLKTGKIIPSGDLITDFSIIKNKFLDGDFELIYGIDDLLSNTNYNDMIMEYRTEYGIYPEIYFTEDSFGMVIDLVYALGGYAVFEIPYEEIQGSVKLPVK